MLIINQKTAKCEVKHKDLIPYHHVVIKLNNNIEWFYIDKVPLYENVCIDSLASFAAILVLPPRLSKHVTIGNSDLCCHKIILEDNEAHQIGKSFKP